MEYFLLLILYSILITSVILILKTRKVLFEPISSYPMFILIYTIPYIFLYLTMGEEIFGDRTAYNLGGDHQVIVIRFLMLKLMSLVFFILGCRIVSYKSKSGNLQFLSQRVHRLRDSILYLFGFLYILSIFFIILYIDSVGGISFVIRNLALKSEYMKGTGHFLSITVMLSYFTSFIGLISSIVLPLRKKWIYISLIALSLILLLLGSRSISFRILLILTTVSYFVDSSSWVSFFSFRYVLKIGFLLLIASIVIIGFPIVRARSYAGSELKGSGYTEIMNNFEELAKGNIYTEIQLNILKAFETNIDHWHGKSYLDLVYVPIPRHIMPDKPSADDGLYIFNLVIGNHVTLGQNFASHLTINSWPPATFGIAYANYGTFGIAIAYLLLGMVLSWLYLKMLNSRMSFPWVFIYVYAFWRLQLSNLLIIDFLSMLVIVGGFFFVVRKFRLFS